MSRIHNFNFPREILNWNPMSSVHRANKAAKRFEYRKCPSVWLRGSQWIHIYEEYGYLWALFFLVLVTCSSIWRVFNYYFFMYSQVVSFIFQIYFLVTLLYSSSFGHIVHIPYCCFSEGHFFTLKSSVSLCLPENFPISQLPLCSTAYLCLPHSTQYLLYHLFGIYLILLYTHISFVFWNLNIQKNNTNGMNFYISFT